MLEEKVEQYLTLCHNELLKREAPLGYLKSRFVTDQDLKDFNFGFSPCHWDIQDEKFNMEFPEYKNRLPQKIVMPIKNFKGETSGFTLRSFTGDKFYFKFLYKPHMNFHHLYGFYENLEAILSYKKVMIVESPFDVIALRPWVPFAVAVLSSKLTDLQAHFLKRYVNKVYLGFNNDFSDNFNAGKHATVKAQKLLKSCGLRNSIVTLPNKQNDFSSFRGSFGDISDYLYSKIPTLQEI